MIKKTLKADEFGRITIPKNIRETLGIDMLTRVDILYDSEQLVIPKVNNLDDMRRSMNKVIEIADNSFAISNKEYENLNQILGKLRKEIEVK